MSTKRKRLPLEYPKYNEAEQLCLRRFLAVYLTAAQKALESELTIASNDSQHPLFKSRIDYWKNVCSGIEWLNHFVDTGQEWMSDYPLTEYESELRKCIRHW